MKTKKPIKKHFYNSCYVSIFFSHEIPLSMALYLNDTPGANSSDQKKVPTISIYV